MTNRTVAPVRLCHEAPVMAPIEAFRRLAAYQPMLLDGMGAHPEARYAYVACHPAFEVRFDATGMQKIGPETHARRDGAMLDLLRELTDDYHWPVDEPEGFTGGFAGVFHYEAVHAMEEGLGPAPAGDLARLWLFRDVWVLDRQEDKAWLWTTDLPGEADAHERAARLQDALRKAPTHAQTGDAGVPAQDSAWTPSLDQEAFATQMLHLQELIAAGDHYQTNLATRWSAPCDAEPTLMYERLAAGNPSPFMGLIQTPEDAIISCSPEQLLAVQDGTIRSRPIAGTRPRDADSTVDAAYERELLEDAKEQAEHTMLVDLVRNDIARVAQPGSVHVAERMSVERYRHVMHLVSRVEGRLRPGTGFADWMAALFPGGTITGAPKHRACLRIAGSEPVPRGPYTGSMGYLSWSHNAHWNILIRTLHVVAGQAHVHAGSGIVMDSVPEREWEEARHKARALLQAATGEAQGGSTTRLGEVTRHGTWEPPRPSVRVDANVLLIDNYDSFTHNVADYCAALGADVTVLRNDRAWQDTARDASHIILSPGPGRPEDAGACEQIVRDAEIPVLGVCLGHQAMATATGGRVVRGTPVHGKPALARHHGDGLFTGLPDPLAVTRYHSLIVDRDTLPSAWAVDAWLEDGTIMAMHHRKRPLWGVQFHPESLCTDRGLEIIQRFLEA